MVPSLTCAGPITRRMGILFLCALACVFAQYDSSSGYAYVPSDNPNSIHLFPVPPLPSDFGQRNFKRDGPGGWLGES